MPPSLRERTGLDEPSPADGGSGTTADGGRCPSALATPTCRDGTVRVQRANQKATYYPQHITVLNPPRLEDRALVSDERVYDAAIAQALGLLAPGKDALRQAVSGPPDPEAEAKEALAKLRIDADGAVAFAAIAFERRDCRHENSPPPLCSPPAVRLCRLSLPLRGDRRRGPYALLDLSDLYGIRRVGLYLARQARMAVWELATLVPDMVDQDGALRRDVKEKFFWVLDTVQLPDVTGYTLAQPLQPGLTLPAPQEQGPATSGRDGPRIGRIANATLGDYLIPVNADLPDMEVLFVGEPDRFNPIGVKGVGEIGLVGIAAAIANAVYHATGRRVRSLAISIDQLL